MKRRTFVYGAISLGGVAGAALDTGSAAGDGAPLGPLVWPLVTKAPLGGQVFDGHTDTVIDVVGRIGQPPSLAIFTEGNHLMALLSADIIGAFPAWAKSQPRYASLDLSNIVVVTLPQPAIVQLIRAGAVTFGNLTLDVNRQCGFYPDVIMAGPEPLRELAKLEVIDRQARFFAKNRGLAMLVRKGNPLGIHRLADVARSNAKLALPDEEFEAGSRANYRKTAEALIGKNGADALFAAEAANFPGRLGIVHRDFPEMVARGYADVALTQYHLVSYWTRIFPNRFELVPIESAERYFAKIAYGRVIDPLRQSAAGAFEEFFFGTARAVYPKYDLAVMTEQEFGETLMLN
jgi:hypothetical protein